MQSHSTQLLCHASSPAAPSWGLWHKKSTAKKHCWLRGCDRWGMPWYTMGYPLKDPLPNQILPKNSNSSRNNILSGHKPPHGGAGACWPGAPGATPPACKTVKTVDLTLPIIPKAFCISCKSCEFPSSSATIPKLQSGNKNKQLSTHHKSLPGLLEAWPSEESFLTWKKHWSHPWSVDELISFLL